MYYPNSNSTTTKVTAIIKPSWEPVLWRKGERVWHKLKCFFVLLNHRITQARANQWSFGITDQFTSPSHSHSHTKHHTPTRLSEQLSGIEIENVTRVVRSCESYYSNAFTLGTITHAARSKKMCYFIFKPNSIIHSWQRPPTSGSWDTNDQTVAPFRHRM